MEWQVLSTEDANGLKFASKTGAVNKYKALLDAVEHGPVKVLVPSDSILQSLKWGLSRAIKKANVMIIIATFADKSGVVLTKSPAPSAKEQCTPIKK